VSANQDIAMEIVWTVRAMAQRRAIAAAWTSQRLWRLPLLSVDWLACLSMAAFYRARRHFRAHPEEVPLVGAIALAFAALLAGALTVG
jgi:hypothetical protein